MMTNFWDASTDTSGKFDSPGFMTEYVLSPALLCKNTFSMNKYRKPNTEQRNRFYSTLVITSARIIALSTS